MTDTPRPDIPTIMAEIREKVRKEIDNHQKNHLGVYPKFKPKIADENGEKSRRAGELTHSEDLRVLNQLFSAGPSLRLDLITSHRPGFLGKTIVWIKRKLIEILWRAVLQQYFEKERDLLHRVVRFLYDMISYVDSRDAAIFWELVRKIDTDVSRALTRAERIHDDLLGTLNVSERRMSEDVNKRSKELMEYISDLLIAKESHRCNIQRLESVTQGIESILANLRPEPKNVNSFQPNIEVDYRYLLFENRFRGSQEEIQRRLSVYAEIFLGVGLPVLDIGCGEGELLSILAQAGIPCYGIDLDKAMIQEACANGHKVFLEDAISHLKGLHSRSLGGIAAIQVIEHFTNQTVDVFLELAKDKVAVGGKIVLETINPKSLLALSSNYFRDPTHVFPQHPDTLAFRLTMAGLKVLEVRYLSPVQQEALLREIPLTGYMTPRWHDTINQINQNIKQLNHLLYGFQDYCVVASVV